jgi:hypothetical protein
VTRAILIIALVINALFAGWILSGQSPWAPGGLEPPYGAAVLGVAAASLLAAGLLFGWRIAGGLLALLAGGGGLVIGLALAAILQWAGHDTSLERIGVLLPGAATIILAIIDLAVVLFVGRH